MHRLQLRLLMATAGICLLIAAGTSYGTPARDAFFDRAEEGWFWYEVEPEPDPSPKVKPTPTPVVPQQPIPTEEPVPVEGPAPLSAAWIRGNVEKYLDAALDNPTPENVQAFLYVQRVAMDKGNAFSDMVARVVPGNPDLDETYRRPVNTRGVNNVDAQAADVRDQITRELGQSKGMFFFFRSDCPYCHAIAPVIAVLRDLYGVNVLAISIDGKGLPGKHFETFRINRGQAQKLNVQTVPALFLADLTGTKQIAPIGSGVMALPEIQQRMIIAAVNEGWISEDRYQEARPYFDIGRSFADAMQSPAFQRMAEESTDKTNFIPPAQIINALKGNE